MISFLFHCLQRERERGKEDPFLDSFSILSACLSDDSSRFGIEDTVSIWRNVAVERFNLANVRVARPSRIIFIRIRSGKYAGPFMRGSKTSLQRVFARQIYQCTAADRSTTTTFHIAGILREREFRLCRLFFDILSTMMQTPIFNSFFRHFYFYRRFSFFLSFFFSLLR